MKSKTKKQPTQQEIANKAEVTRSTVAQVKRKQKKEEQKKKKEREVKKSGEVVPYFWSRKFPDEMRKETTLVKVFDMTGYPLNPEDAVCPHFLQLKWAYGCPYKCAWCYLQGSLRGKVNPVVRNYREVVKNIFELFDNKELKDRVEVCNTGELADSIASGNKSLQILMLTMFASQTDTNHKILFLSKSDQIGHFLYLPDEVKKHSIFSFTINADAVSKKYEKGAPNSSKRIQAAKKLSDVGYNVRLRIDPVLPIKDWEQKYLGLIDSIDFRPDRITIGTLRVVNPKTIKFCKKRGLDDSWTNYLDDKSQTGWGLKMSHDVRKKVNEYILNRVLHKWKGIEVGFCKETRRMWEDLGLEWKDIKCNCIG